MAVSGTYTTSKTERSPTQAFEPNDPTLMDRYPGYDMDKHLGDRPLNLI
jgi:hypothetical protein